MLHLDSPESLIDKRYGVYRLSAREFGFSRQVSVNNWHHIADGSMRDRAAK
jgi:hypothetical protein